MDLLQAFQTSGFAGVGAAIGTSLKQTGSLQGISNLTNNALFASPTSPAGASNPFAPDWFTKLLIFGSATIIGISLVKRLV